METIRKRALEDIDNQLAAHFRKRRRHDQASDTNTPTQPMTTSHSSIAASSPTLVGSPAPVTPSRTLHPSTPPSSISSSASSETSETESDSSGSSSGESDSLGYASTSSADQQPRSHLPSLSPRVISPETSSSSSSGGGGTSTDSGSYTSASVSDDITDLLSSSSSSSEDSQDDEDEESSSSSGSSSSSSSSSSGSSSSDSALSSSTSNSLQPSLPPHLSVTSLTADNLSTLQSRLNALLPKMKDANAVLEAERKDGKLGERNIENIGDTEGGGQEGEYIEMNLGLGVLEQREEEVENSGSGERDDESGDEREKRESDEPEERDLMGRLLNRNRVAKPNSKALVKEVEA